MNFLTHIQESYEYSMFIEYQDSFDFDIVPELTLILKNNEIRYAPIEIEIKGASKKLRFFDVHHDSAINENYFNGMIVSGNGSDEEELKSAHETIKTYIGSFPSDKLLVVSNSKKEFMEFKLKF